MINNKEVYIENGIRCWVSLNDYTIYVIFSTNKYSQYRAFPYSYYEICEQMRNDFIFMILYYINKDKLLDKYKNEYDPYIFLYRDLLNMRFDIANKN